MSPSANKLQVGNPSRTIPLRQKCKSHSCHIVLRADEQHSEEGLRARRTNDLAEHIEVYAPLTLVRTAQCNEFSFCSNISNIRLFGQLERFLEWVPKKRALFQQNQNAALQRRLSTASRSHLHELLNAPWMENANERYADWIYSSLPSGSGYEYSSCRCLAS